MKGSDVQSSLKDFLTFDKKLNQKITIISGIKTHPNQPNERSTLRLMAMTYRQNEKLSFSHVLVCWV